MGTLGVTDKVRTHYYLCLLEVMVTVVTPVLGRRVHPFRSCQGSKEGNQSGRPWTVEGTDDKGQAAWVWHEGLKGKFHLKTFSTLNDCRRCALHFVAHFVS